MPVRLKILASTRPEMPAPTMMALNGSGADFSIFCYDVSNWSFMKVVKLRCTSQGGRPTSSQHLQGIYVLCMAKPPASAAVPRQMCGGRSMTPRARSMHDDESVAGGHEVLRIVR